MNPKFSIIIPCKNSASSIKDTIKTVLNNNYSNYEIIICDNNSQDNTFNIIDNFNSDKITYIRSNKNLSMSESWERGLDHISGEYVLYLGADDGLIKDSFEYALDLILKYSCDVITWEKPNFQLPSAFYKPNSLRLNKKNYCLKLNPKKNLIEVLKGKLAYSYLPSIYNSFIKTSIIKDLRTKESIFFKGIHPDIYSSLIISSMVSNQIYSTFGLSINGASDKSNGLNNCQGDNLDSSKDFFKSTKNSTMSKKYPSIVGLPSSYVLDSLAVFINTKRDYFRFLKTSKYIEKIINDLVRITPGKIRKSVCEELTKKYIFNDNQKNKIQKLAVSNVFIEKKSSENIINIYPEALEFNFNKIKNISILEAQEIINNFYYLNFAKHKEVSFLGWKLRKLIQRIIFKFEKKI